MAQRIVRRYNEYTMKWELICPKCQAKEFNITKKKTTQWHIRYWSCICKLCNNYWLTKRIESD